MKTFFKLSFSVFLILGILPKAKALDVTAFERLAIQDGGRTKPFDTFARESVQLITGSQNHQNRNATELVLSWLFLPDQWSHQKFIQIKHLQLKKDLGIAETESFVSPSDLVGNQRLGSLFTQLLQKQKDKKKLDPYFSAVARVNNQLSVFQGIIQGTSIRLVPQFLSQDWLSLPELSGEPQLAFNKVATQYFTAITKKDDTSFIDAIKGFKVSARAQAAKIYPAETSLDYEIIYNKLHAFRWAYVIYLIAALLFTFSLKFPKKTALRNAALGVTGLGLALHIAGFVFRCVVAGRPPVSNMYESIIWVSLGCVVFGLVLELIYKRHFIGIAATVMATLALIVGDSVPAVLDQSIKPLEPVLRSNYWLTIHVLTITLSYAAFMLSFGIGNIALLYYARGVEAKNRDKLQALALFTYRAVQVGVLLLTAGTILGGVWADYSWGRFWGWDPKETWALIADLGYLAVLHGRFSGWLRTFGLISASVCCFTGVVMAWYGVNFVLGVGLHSYGFGGGGVQYVASIAAAEWVFVGWCALKHRKVLISKAKTA